MKILAIETHYKTPRGGNKTSGVDYWRIISPFTHLRNLTGWDIDIQKGGIPEGDLSLEETSRAWESVGRKYDVIWTSYFGQAAAYSWLSVACKRFNHKFVIDYDDNFLQMSDTNIVKWEYDKDPEHFKHLTKIAQDAPVLSVTNSNLKNLYKNLRDNQGKIHILPNYIDLEFHKALPRIKKDHLTIAYQGGPTHWGDLMHTGFDTAISYVLGKYQGKVRFEIAGFLPSDLEQIPYVDKLEGVGDFYDWQKMWKDRSRYWDIGVAPLEETPFNEGKSPIKVMEYGAAKIPTVASYWGPYKSILKHSKNGFMCSTVSEWVEYLTALVNNEELRLNLGNAMYENLVNNWTIQKNVYRWKDAIENL